MPLISILLAWRYNSEIKPVAMENKIIYFSILQDLKFCIQTYGGRRQLAAIMWATPLTPAPASAYAPSPCLSSIDPGSYLHSDPYVISGP